MKLLVRNPQQKPAADVRSDEQLVKRSSQIFVAATLVFVLDELLDSPHKAF